MSKMGSHYSFGHLKHNLWPKEGLGVKLPVWLPTKKSRELTRFIWLQTTCHTPLKSSRRELQLCFRAHLDPRSTCKVMGLQSRGSALSAVVYSPRPDGFPQVRAVVSFVCPCCPWLVLAPKVLQLCTNHFVWVVCRPVWVSKLVNSSSPIPELQHAPLPLKVLWARECTSTPPSSVDFHLESHLSLLKS